MIERVAELFPDFRLDPQRPPTWKPRGDIRGLATLHLVNPIASGNPLRVVSADCR